MYQLHHGDCLDILRGLPTASADSLVSDPPGALSFMGMGWDGDKGGRAQWVAWLAERMRAARRVVKTGHYGLVWALPRTSHWTALALEDAGWEIRDRVAHIFGSGFPKHKSALKPAVEDWWLVRNPGKGGPALNIDEARVEGIPPSVPQPLFNSSTGLVYGMKTGFGRNDEMSHATGRWPAHLVLSHSADCNGVCAPGCPMTLLDAQSGKTKSIGGSRGKGGMWGCNDADPSFKPGFGDTGGASRFFTRLDAGDYDPFIYAAKASRAERNRGCEGLEARETRDHNILTSGYRTDPRSPNGGYENKPAPPRANHHPTVKSQALMQWLCRLITPPSGVVFDPFCGSASTGVAAAALGMDFIGCEQEAEYISIARARLDAAYTPLAHMEAV